MYRMTLPYALQHNGRAMGSGGGLGAARGSTGGGRHRSRGRTWVGGCMGPPSPLWPQNAHDPIKGHKTDHMGPYGPPHPKSNTKQLYLNTYV